MATPHDVAICFVWARADKIIYPRSKEEAAHRKMGSCLLSLSLIADPFCPCILLVTVVYAPPHRIWLAGSGLAEKDNVLCAMCYFSYDE